MDTIMQIAALTLQLLTLAFLIGTLVKIELTIRTLKKRRRGHYDGNRQYTQEHMTWRRDHLKRALEVANSAELSHRYNVWDFESNTEVLLADELDRLFFIVGDDHD